MKKVLVYFPAMIIKVELVGHNSLLGALCEKLIEKNFIKDIGILDPEKIVFVIKQVQENVNIYEELNKVRDVLKINESKISLFVE